MFLLSVALHILPTMNWKSSPSSEATKLQLGVWVPYTSLPESSIVLLNTNLALDNLHSSVLQYMDKSTPMHWIVHGLVPRMMPGIAHVTTHCLLWTLPHIYHLAKELRHLLSFRLWWSSNSLSSFAGFIICQP